MILINHQFKHKNKNKFEKHQDQQEDILSANFTPNTSNKMAVTFLH